jgi:sugar lactone lactonase YvrE
MDPKQENKPLGLTDRFRERWFPPAAVAGAFGAFIAAIFKTRPSAKAAPPPAVNAGLTNISFGKPSAAKPALPRQYRPVATLGGAAPFKTSLDGIALDNGGNAVVLGDGEIRIFKPGGNLVRRWKASEKATCVAVAPDGRIYIAANGRVEIYDSAGTHTGGFAAGETSRTASITAIRVLQNDILVADAAALLIRRFNLQGKPAGLIGNRSKAGKFILPNKSLDLAVDANNRVYATDTGRHQVTCWTLDGAPQVSFGKFGMSQPEDFVGCCNPVNIAAAPEGKIVTAEKMVARVKVYEPDGRLLAVIGPENFDPACTHIYLAVDSQGRIFAGDPVRREVKIFAQTGKQQSGAEA